METFWPFSHAKFGHVYVCSEYEGKCILIAVLEVPYGSDDDDIVSLAMGCGRFPGLCFDYIVAYAFVFPHCDVCSFS